MATRAEIEAGRAFVRLFLKNDMSRQLVQALRAAQAKLREFGQSAMAMGRRVALAGVVMAAPFTLATRTFASFDDAMREVAAVTQATGEDFDRLTAKAKELGASTSYTAVEVGLLMAELGRAGFVPSQIETMTGSVLALARATKTEGALSAGIMGAAIRQFSLEAEDAARVADVLTAGANKSFNTLETLGESLKYAGPVANDFNMSLEDTVAILGTLGNVGIQGSQAGSTLRRLLILTGAEAEKLNKIFGVQFVDAAGNARPLVDTLQDIADKTRNLGTAERSAKFNEAFGLLGITGASAISKNIAGTRDLRDAIAESGGTAQKTAAMMDAGLGGALRILKSAVEGVAIATGEALAPRLQRLASFLTGSAQSAIAFIKANQGIVTTVAAVVAGIPLFGVALMGLGAAAYAASFGLGALAAVIAVVTSPVGLLITAIAGGAAAWLAFTDSGQQAMTSLKASVLPIIDTIKSAFGGVVDALMIGDWGLAGQIAMTGLKLAFLEGLQAIRQMFPTTFDAILGIAGMALDGLASMFGEAMTLLQDQWNRWGKHVLDTVVSVAGGVVSVWQKAVEGMANWMLATSAKGGVMGKAMSKVLGVDMAAEQERADRLDKQLGLGKTDVLADAQADVRRITEQWEIQAKAGLAESAKAADAVMQGIPDGLDTDFEGALERFAKALESGQNIEAVAIELVALKAKAKKLTDENATTPETTTKPTGAVASGGVATETAAPRGVALTATYSAAAARISGYQPADEQKKMVAGIDRVARILDHVAENDRELLQAMKQFVAGWKVS